MTASATSEFDVQFFVDELRIRMGFREASTKGTWSPEYRQRAALVKICARAFSHERMLDVLNVIAKCRTQTVKGGSRVDSAEAERLVKAFSYQMQRASIAIDRALVKLSLRGEETYLRQLIGDQEAEFWRQGKGLNSDSKSVMDRLWLDFIELTEIFGINHMTSIKCPLLYIEPADVRIIMDRYGDRLATSLITNCIAHHLGDPYKAVHELVKTVDRLADWANVLGPSNLKLFVNNHPRTGAQRLPLLLPLLETLLEADDFSPSTIKRILLTHLDPATRVEELINILRYLEDRAPTLPPSILEDIAAGYADAGGEIQRVIPNMTARPAWFHTEQKTQTLTGVRQHRADGMTLREAAAQFGITPQTVNRWQREAASRESGMTGPKLIMIMHIIMINGMVKPWRLVDFLKIQFPDHQPVYLNGLWTSPALTNHFPI